MSYDYMLFQATERIDEPEDFGPETVDKLDPEEVVGQLNDHLAGIDWTERREDTSAMPPDPEFQPPEAVWSGEFRDADDGWVEFQMLVRGGQCDCLHVNTSTRTDDGELVADLCRALGMTGLDGQKMTLIRPGA